MHFRRRRTALRFDRVLAVKCRNISRDDPDAVLNLLAVEFTDDDPPSGFITLVFSGDAALRGGAWNSFRSDLHHQGRACRGDVATRPESDLVRSFAT